MSEDVKCKKCGGVRLVKNGTQDQHQRYLCRECGAVFTSKPRKYSEEIKNKALEMYLNNTGIRKIALFLEVSPPLVLQWIRARGKMLHDSMLTAANPSEMPPVVEHNNDVTDCEPDIIEMDEIFTYVKKNANGQSFGRLTLGAKTVLLRIT